MTGLVASVRKELDPRCLEEGETLRGPKCQVSLAAISASRVVANLDAPGAPLGQQEARCDFLLFVEQGRGEAWQGLVVPLELKARLEMRKVTEQLQAGADAADKLVADASRVAFIPVVACRLKKGQRRRLKESLMRVRFKNRTPETIRRMNCGGALAGCIRWP